ncbi:MAG: sugar ABC transporter substrate-binding protein [Synergistaceae bacterium]|nr:sugar ABC transporter substrate-binding protein [Synergistaceae bacterium]
MRKLLSVIAVFVLVLTAAAVFCAAPAEAAKKQYAFVMPNATHGFMAAAIQSARDSLERIGPNYPDIDHRLLTSADPSEQSNQLATLINEKVDTIVLWPHNGDDLRSAAQDVIDAGIKLVVFDRLIPDIAPISEVDMDNFAYGAFLAKALNEHFKDRLDAGEKIQILEIRGDNSTASTHRVDGVMATKHPNISVVQSVITDWQRAKGLEFMESFLTNNSVADIEAIDAIISFDGEPAAGAYDAILNYNGPASLKNLKVFPSLCSFAEQVSLIGEMYEKSGILHPLGFVNPGCTVYGVQVGFDVADGKEVPKVVKIGYIEVNNSNYLDFLAILGN